MTEQGNDRSPETHHLLCVGYGDDARDRLSTVLEEETLSDVTTHGEERIHSAIEILETEDVDCVVSEYHLDDGTVEELIQHTGDVPIVLFVERGSEAIASEAVSLGVDEYVARTDRAESYRELAAVVGEIVVNLPSGAHRDTTPTDLPFDALPIIFFTIDDEGTITRSRGRGLANIGLEPGELVGESLYEMYADLTGAIESYEAALGGERTTVPLDLEGRVIETTFAPMQDEGSVHGVIGLSVDVTDQAEAEREAERLSRAIDTSMDGVAMLDAEGEYTYVNDAHASVYGFDEPEQMVGRSWTELYDGGELERFEQEVMPALEREGTWRGEAIGTRTDGTTFPQELTLSALEAGGLICVVRDITDRKAMTDELARTKAEFQAVLDNALAAIYMRDLDGRYRYANEQFADLVGLSPDVILGEPATAIHSEGDILETIEAGDREALEAGTAIRREEELWIDDKRRTFVTTKVPLVDGDDEPYAVYGISTEISEVKERQRILQSLNETAPRLMDANGPEAIARIAVETARDALDLPVTGVWRYDSEESALVPSVTSERANEQFDEHPVFRPDQGMAWSVFERQEPWVAGDVASKPDVYNPDTAIKSEMIFPLGEHGVLICGSLRHRQFDAHDREFGTILAATTTSALTRDDRERRLRRRERELERKNDRLEEFANVVAHDIRNPLTVAKGYLEVEQEGGGGRFLDKIEGGIDRTIELVDNLLTLARAGERVGDLERVDVDTVATQAWSTVRTGDARLLLEGEHSVAADRLRLTQLFENLFRNAIEHGGTDVTVRIGTFEDGAGFYVADDGPGIPAEKRETLFGGRERSEADDARRFGLAIVSDIVDAHGWDITVAESENGGARFDVRTGERHLPGGVIPDREGSS